MTKLVGILNITPDSFSDGGQFINPDVAIAHAEKLFNDGASLVDIGAESTRPNATALSDDEEWARLEPVLRFLLPRYGGKLSLDTYHPQTVRKAFEIGPIIINDITGLNNPEMVKVVSELDATVIISHHPDISIQAAHMTQPVTTIQQVKDELLQKATILEAAGMKRNQIILDPGIGFGKSMKLNEVLLTFAEQVPDYQVMIGYSRKRFLGDDRMMLAPNLAAGKIAISHGAGFLRVHDVLGHAGIVS